MLRKNPKVLKALLKVIKFQPFNSQQKIIEAFLKFRFLCIVCGRRFGKSRVASLFVLYTLLEKDANVLCVSKNYKLAKKVWNYVSKDAKKLFGSDIQINKGEMKAFTRWGSSLELGSADNPDSLLGDAYDLVIADEAATLSSKLFQQNLLPMIREKKGTLVLITTPRGYNWLHKIYEQGVAKVNGWWSIQASAFDNTQIYDAEEIELIKSQTDKLYYEQEYLALFRAYANQVYSEFDREKHVVKEYPKDWKSWERYVAIDPGYNNGAMVFFGYNKTNNEFFIYDEVMEHQIEHLDFLRHLITKEPPSGYDGIIADVASHQVSGESGRSFKKFLQEQDWFLEKNYHIFTKKYRIISGVNKIRTLILSVNGSIKLHIHEGCTRTIECMENYSYPENNKEEPMKDGVHDHLADALRYGVEYCYKQKEYKHIDL